MSTPKKPAPEPYPGYNKKLIEVAASIPFVPGLTLTEFAQQYVLTRAQVPGQASPEHDAGCAIKAFRVIAEAAK